MEGREAGRGECMQLGGAVGAETPMIQEAVCLRQHRRYSDDSSAVRDESTNLFLKTPKSWLEWSRILIALVSLFLCDNARDLVYNHWWGFKGGLEKRRAPSFSLLSRESIITAQWGSTFGTHIIHSIILSIENKLKRKSIIGSLFFFITDTCFLYSHFCLLLFFHHFLQSTPVENRNSGGSTRSSSSSDEWRKSEEGRKRFAKVTAWGK